MRYVFVGLLVFATFALFQQKRMAQSGNTDSAVVCVPVDYKNGVYYFPCIRAEFANTLSRFRAEHPDLEIVDVTGNGNNDYFVIVSPK